jgi:molybdenum cofactor cytidylyltransferase
MSFATLILAAGASSRMGKPKLLLPWGETSIIGHLVAQWQRAGASQIAVVLASGDKALERELKRIGFPLNQCIPNPSPERGMFSSIQCAARWTGWNANLRHWVIALGDQPHLRPETLLALVALGTSHPESVCQLRRQGRPRHPVLLPAAAFRQIGNSADANLKEFLKNLPLDFAHQESDDAGLDLDIDHPTDYEKALRLFS